MNKSCRIIKHLAIASIQIFHCSYSEKIISLLKDHYDDIAGLQKIEN